MTEFRGTERFEVLNRLGAGGMGVVYEVLDRERSAKVALKTLRSADPELILALKSEFRGLADLEHPNLVSRGELFEEHGVWFFTMDSCAGSTSCGTSSSRMPPPGRTSMRRRAGSTTATAPAAATPGFAARATRFRAGPPGAPRGSTKDGCVRPSRSSGAGWRSCTRRARCTATSSRRTCS